MKPIYWITKNGTKIDIDKMTIDHLRNVLKMIVRSNQSVSKTCPNNTSMAFSNEEVELLTKKSQYQFESEENLWS